MITALISLAVIGGLTRHDSALKMPSPLTHSAVWFSSHKKHKMPIKSASTRRLRYHMQQLIYGGRYLGSFGSQGSCALSTNPNNVRRQKFSSLKRCSLTFTREFTMSQNQSASNPQTKTVSCLFSVFHHRKLIAQNITGLLALRFKRRYPAIVVKFAQMEVVA